MLLRGELLINHFKVMREKHISSYTVTAVLFTISLTLSGCSPNSVSPIIPLKAGELSATVSGLGSFFADRNTVADTTTSSYHIHASMQNKDNNDSLVIDLLVSRKDPPPYSNDVSTDGYAKIAYCIIKPDGSCKNYSADKLGGGAGQIGIASLYPTLQGTFSGSLQLVGGSESVSISDGRFNADYK